MYGFTATILTFLTLRFSKPRSFFSNSVTAMSCSPWITWLLVITCPSLETMKPEPSPVGVEISTTEGPVFSTFSRTDVSLRFAAVL